MPQPTALEEAMTKINRSYGAGSISRLGDPSVRMAVEAISTGSIALDSALGVGGMPRGRIVEVYGPESSGKTTVCLHVAAQAQAMGLTVAFIDAEHALDPRYAEAVGVCTSDLLISQPDYGEQALQIADDLIGSGQVGVVIVDSVAALTPKVELDGEMGDATVGAQARMMSQAMRKLAAKVYQTKTLLIFTNQLREKIGVMWGSPETQPGGRALKFYASQRLDIRRIGTDKDSHGDAFQNRVRVKVVKNKVASPYRECELELVFGVGIDGVGELLDLGVSQGVIVKSSSWFTVGDDKVQGRPAAKDALRLQTGLMASIRAAALNS